MRLIACLYDPKGQLSKNHPLVRQLLPHYLASCPHGGHWLQAHYLALYDRAEDFQLLGDQGFGLTLGHPLLYPDRGATLALLHSSPYRWLESCRGHFALFQGLSGHLLAATDALGMLPLYQLELEGALLLSNDLNWLAGCQPDARPDPDAMLDWLSLGFPLGQGSGYQGISALPGGHYWLGKGRQLSCRRYQYWHPQAPLVDLAPMALRARHFEQAGPDWGPCPAGSGRKHQDWQFQPGASWAQSLFTDPRDALSRQQLRYQQAWQPFAALPAHQGNGLFRLSHDLRWRWQTQAREQQLALSELPLSGLDTQALINAQQLPLPAPQYPQAAPRARLCQQGLALWRKRMDDLPLLRQLFGTLLGQTQCARLLQARLLFRTWQKGLAPGRTATAHMGNKII